MADDAIRPTEQRPRLGKGLAALLGENHDPRIAVDQSRLVRKTPIEYLRPNPRNPRKAFVEEELEELAASIRERGIIQPVLVRAIPGLADAFEIVAGERRWRAAQRAEQHEVPILVIEASDREALEIAIVENVQRADLNALEEANGYAQLSTDHGYNHSDIARVVGKSRSHITNMLRLTNLPEHTRALLTSRAISAGHARALLAVANPDPIADRVVAEGLTVRDVERLAASTGKSARQASKLTRLKDPDVRALEERLSLDLGAKVTIRRYRDAGEIRVGFQSLEQLDDFCHRLCRRSER